MDAWPRHPVIYEIDTWPWLHALSQVHGSALDLGTVPDGEWDRLAACGFDAVWLMGVWERSPAGLAVDQQDDSLVASWHAVLADLQPDDVVGSPYCVRDYRVDSRLGGDDGLAVARAALGQRGLRLVLDFVPNHVAPDHPWVSERPELLVAGTPDDLRDDPRSFIAVGGRVFANGRDPFFPAWRDVVQLNAFAPELRAAAAATVASIADRCDGVRCDMAMLVTNDVFARTWGARAGPRPDTELWPAVIDAVRQAHPDFRFIAEVYWDLEATLQDQGFDHCYDKRLYDRLLHDDAESVRMHLLADEAYQTKLVRFLENHDEPRLASLVEPAAARAFAVAAATLPGARLVHQGQEEGRVVHTPVFFARWPPEDPVPGVVAFYRRLWEVVADPTFRHGHWELCERSGWEGDDTYRNLLAWCWDGGNRWLVVVNLSATTSRARVQAPWADLVDDTCRLVDDTNDVVYERSGRDLHDGLFVELRPWSWHLWRVEPEVRG